MVRRKPGYPAAATPQYTQASNDLPYPLSPGSASRTPGNTNVQSPTGSINIASAPKRWMSDAPDTDDQLQATDSSRPKATENIPATLRVRGGLNAEANVPTSETLPSSLRAGPTEETIKPSESERSNRRSGNWNSQIPSWRSDGTQAIANNGNGSSNPYSNNPYLRSKSALLPTSEIGQEGQDKGDSIWGQPPIQTSRPDGPAEAAPDLKIRELGEGTIHSTSNSRISSSTHNNTQADIVLSQTAKLSLFDYPKHEGMPSSDPGATSDPPVREAPRPTNANVYEQNATSARSSLMSFTSEESWDAPPKTIPKKSEGGFNFFPDDTKQLSIEPQELGGKSIFEAPELFSKPASPLDKALPTLPSQQDEEVAPDVPPRSNREGLDRIGNIGQNPVGLTVMTDSKDAALHIKEQQNKATKQRSETYQIKHVRWYDESSRDNPRTSPILVQNANGPCPLLALVNALTLSTPSSSSTALVETLRVREQVSLGLLLDAVFDELTSGRRGAAAQELPDVGDLYAFLVTLHTGMNVNPIFILSDANSRNIANPSGPSPPLTIHERRNPGGFEETREMRLYSTFAVPLIHGWLPPSSHRAYAALSRSARTYEDAQNLMFREEELEDKLRRQGLNQDEQLLLEDIGSIKYFLSSSATQLTGYGLDTMTEALSPGSIAILFRNDHFSTMYRHPRSGQLLTLVTDFGYAGHDEVVWESLVDVSGEGCEFFAGDFRPVGNSTSKIQPQTNDHASGSLQGWTTVSRSTAGRLHPRLRGPQSPPTTPDSHSPLNYSRRISPPSTITSNLQPRSPTTEQEDHDLALAMQLQEEEEDRSRRSLAARRCEDELSHAYLSSESQDPTQRRGLNPNRPGAFEGSRPTVPPRTGSTAVNRDPERGDEAPPPTYEQAAKGPAYHPPPDHPAHPNAPPIAGRNGDGLGARPSQTRPRQASAYSQNTVNVASVANPTLYPGPGSRRRSSAARSSSQQFGRNCAPPPGVDESREDGKDCVVM